MSKNLDKAVSRVPVIMYHGISNRLSGRDKRYCTKPERFQKQMNYLYRKGYRTIGFDDLVRHLSTSADLPGKPVIITVDDGYRDFYDNAFPVLKNLGFKAAVFLITSKVTEASTWDSGNNSDDRQYLTWQEIKTMSNCGIEFGAHTASHADLETLEYEEVLREIKESKEAIHEHLGMPVKIFAYPYGKFNESVKKAVNEAGFEAACSTMPGFADRKSDLFAIKRIEVYGWDSLFYFGIKIRVGRNKVLRYYYNYYKTRLRERVRKLSYGY